MRKKGDLLYKLVCLPGLHESATPLAHLGPALLCPALLQCLTQAPAYPSPPAPQDPRLPWPGKCIAAPPPLPPTHTTKMASSKG